MDAFEVTTEELRKIPCPNCGGTMDHGFIAGHWFKLRWVETDRTRTVFAGTSLRKRYDSMWSTPTVEAVRCEQCKVGVFRYDY